MAKVDIFSGFLGAGKTTLIRKLIREAYQGEQVVLIENEFGDIGIDGGFLKDSGIRINEMNSGCICCSLVGDFGRALNQVIDEFGPDRILIEPSGVGKLSDIILAVEDLHNDKVKLNGFTTVVDAKKCRMYMKNFGEFFNNQIENASAVILSHTDDLSQERLDECVGLIRGHNRDCEIITTSWGELTGMQILETMERKNGIAAELAKLARDAAEEHEKLHHHHEHDAHGSGHDHGQEHHHHHEGHDADEVFQSVGMETSHRFTERQILDALDGLNDFTEYGQVLRAKGIVQSEDGGWFHFDFVPGEPELRHGPAATTGMICVIGAGVLEDRVRELFGL